MNWEISKEFHFEMGHRVWAQKLEYAHLSVSTDCACKHLHGHSYAIKVGLGSDKLDQSSMVTDFKNLNFMKQFVDDVLDHKFMLDINDPLFDRITGHVPPITVENFTNLSDVARDVDDFTSSFVLVNFVPTSENICRYLKRYAQSKIGDVATVTSLELWETKKSYCKYTGD
jgi:6-pyruvoyltetrahydropterin/6-carboxytetrahydropterin synthase